MGKVSLTEFKTVGDPLLSDSFELVIPTLPTGLNAEAGRWLRIQVKNMIKPGQTIEEALQEAHGHALRFAGKKSFTGSLSLEFVENAQMRAHQTIEDWMNLCRTTEDQRGLTKAEYAVTSLLNILDIKGAQVSQYKIEGFWPKSISELTFDGMGTAVPVSAEFSFDDYKRVTPADVTPAGVTSGA